MSNITSIYTKKPLTEEEIDDVLSQQRFQELKDNAEKFIRWIDYSPEYICSLTCDDVIKILEGNNNRSTNINDFRFQ